MNFKKSLKSILVGVRYAWELTSDSGFDDRFKELTNEISGHSNVNYTHVDNNGASPRVLFVSSNGAGLGHLTRLAAIESKIKGCTLTYSMSSAATKLRKSPRQLIYFPSYKTLGMDPHLWNEILAGHFGAVMDGFSPDVVVFDGTSIYQGIAKAVQKRDTNLIWVNRGTWKKNVDPEWVGRKRSAKSAICVLVPSDYGAKDKLHYGEGVRVEIVNPIHNENQESPLSKDEARAELGLPLEGKLVLVQLGAGSINEVSETESYVRDEILKLGQDWSPVFIRNPLSHHRLPPNCFSIEAYPLSLYYSAFDFAVLAAGYNSVQESVHYELPAILVPNTETGTDDQVRRAQGIEEKKLGLVAQDFESLKSQIVKMSDGKFREWIKSNQNRVRQSNGADKAARIILSLI